MIDRQWPFQRGRRAELRFDSLRWTVTVALETDDDALVEDLFGGVDRRDLVFGDCVAVRCIEVRLAASDKSMWVAELAVGAIASVPPVAAAALIAEWLTDRARKRAARVAIGGRPVPITVGGIRRALARGLGQARRR